MGRKRRVSRKKQRGEARFRRKPRPIDKIAEGVAMGLSGPSSTFATAAAFLRKRSIQGYKRQCATL